MKTASQKSLATVVFAAALAPFLSAQTAVNAGAAGTEAANAAPHAQTAAANAAGGTATRVQAEGSNVITAATNASNAAASASAGTQVAPAAGASAPTAGTIAAGDSVGAVSVSADRTDTVVNPTAAGSGVAEGRPAGANGTIEAGSPGYSSAEANSTPAEIRTAAFEARQQIADHVETRLNDAGQSVATLRQHAGAIGSASRNEFQAALKAAQRQELRVRSSLENLRNATEDKFATAREQLANDYAAYAAAESRVESAGEAGAAGSK